jgi:hypothetical protein
MAAVLLIPAQWATKNDPQLLRILLNSSKFRKQYDPLKFHEQAVKVLRHA